MFKFVLIILIPSLVIFQSCLGFLIPVSVVLIGLVYLLFYNFKTFSLYSRIMKTLWLTVLISHHLVFLFMFIM